MLLLVFQVALVALKRPVFHLKRFVCRCASRRTSASSLRVRCGRTTWHAIIGDKFCIQQQAILKDRITRLWFALISLCWIFMMDNSKFWVEDTTRDADECRQCRRDGYKNERAYLIVDNDYLELSITVPPMKYTCNWADIWFTQRLELLQKDADCTFVILKGHWREGPLK